MKLNLIVASDPSGAIGKSGTLPWKHSKEDMNYFKMVTTSGQKPAVVMGRKTWESLPKVHQPLPGRLNIVVSSGPLIGKADATVHSFHDAFLWAISHGCDSLWVIGGERLYTCVLNEEYFIDEFHVTHMKQRVVDADTFFPFWVFKVKDVIKTKTVLSTDDFEIAVYKMLWN